MNKKNIIILSIVVILIVLGISLYFIFKNSNENKSDAFKFSEEYNTVSKDNVFVYRDIEEIITIMEHGTGIVYLGFPECPWCQSYVKYLEEVAKEVGVEKIYYYNILKDRTNNTPEYQKIISLLSTHLQYDEEGNERIFVPNVSFHIKGEVIGNDYETSLDTHNLDNPDEYWTKEEVKELKDKLKNLMQQVNNNLNSCTDCNK